MHTQEAVAIDVSRIDQQLIKANVTDAVIARLRTDYGTLGDKPIETRDEYEVVHRADMVMRDLQTLAVSTCKKGREQAIAEQRAWIAKEREVTGKIAEVRDPVKARKDEWNAIEQKRIDDAANAQALRVQARKDRLYEVGFRFDGSNYVLDGFASVSAEQLTGSVGDDLDFGAWLNDIDRQVKEHKEREEEMKRTAQIAADALAKQQREEAERQAQVAAEQRRKADELAAKEASMNARILNARAAQLNAIGPVEWPNDQEILAMDDDAFAVFATEAKTKMEARAAAQKAAEEKAAADRKANDARIAKEAVEKTERDRVAAEARAKEEEAERTAKMSDAAKLKAYHAALLAVKVPEMKSKAGQAAIERIVAVLGSLLKKQ